MRCFAVNKSCSNSRHGCNNYSTNRERVSEELTVFSSVRNDKKNDRAFATPTWTM